MKSFSEFKESIIDIPRRTYAPGVFDDEDTDNPKIKDSVLRMISKQFEEFETEYPIIKYSLIGSILTKRYRNDADLDINVLFNIPEDKREEERLRLSKKYLSAASPDSIQGKLIHQTIMDKTATVLMVMALMVMVMGQVVVMETILVGATDNEKFYRF